jgi:hypothetical protein
MQICCSRCESGQSNNVEYTLKVLQNMNVLKKGFTFYSEQHRLIGAWLQKQIHDACVVASEPKESDLDCFHVDGVTAYAKTLVEVMESKLRLF